MRKIRGEASTTDGRFGYDPALVAARAELTPIFKPWDHPHPDWYAIPDGVLCVVDVHCGEVWMKGKGRQWLSEAEYDALIACEP